MSHKIKYLRSSAGNLVGCIASRYNRDNRTVQYQASYCSPYDEFSKSLAREIAVGRLTTKPIEIELDRHFSPGETISTHDVMRAIMTDLHDSGAPSSAVKAAKLWIKNNINGRDDEIGR